MAGKERSHGGHFPKCIVLQAIFWYLRYSLSYRDIEEVNSDNDTAIEVRQVKYLNNIVEQDHRGIKRITNAMFGFKSFDSASVTLNGIEMVHALRKGQLATQDISVQSLAKTFYSLAAWMIGRRWCFTFFKTLRQNPGNNLMDSEAIWISLTNQKHLMCKKRRS